MRILRLLALSLALGSVAPGQDAVLRDSFLQAKSLWSNQGERDAAAARFEQVIAALEPKAKDLPQEWRQVLCEAYNWLAVLDDRSSGQKARVARDLEQILEVDPDFAIDRSLTPARLQAQFDGLRSAKLVKVQLTFKPEGGMLTVDGQPSAPLPAKYLRIGSHRIAYAKPGYASQQKAVEAAAGSSPVLGFDLPRTSSTLRIFVHPVGAEILLDGRSLGRATGTAPADLSPLADKAGLKLEELSGPFVIADLGEGRHVVELRAPCFRTRKVAIGPELLQPFQDHTLEPFRLEPSKGLLTVTSAWPGGEVFLDGVRQGALPLNQVPVCSGTYALEVRFPSGGFAQTALIEDGKALSLSVKPKPRMLFLGFAGDEEFAGRARLREQVHGLPDRLPAVAFLAPLGLGTPSEAEARLKANHEGELFLYVEARRAGSSQRVELVLRTPAGEEERVPIKTLDQDPLAPLVTLLKASPRLREPWAGLSLLDVPGEPGPWVLQADARATAAGIQPFQAITQVDGRAVADVAAFHKALPHGRGAAVTVLQQGRSVTLGLVQAPLEIPQADPHMSYTLLLAELRLKLLGAKGEEASVLRFQQALALMHFRKFERAVELLREAKLGTGSGLGQGTVDYYTGLCLLRLGTSYSPEAIQAFAQAASAPASTLLGPDGPLVAPLAKQAVDDLK